MPLDANATDWIAKQVQATLSHYPSDWSQSADVADVALAHWVDALAPFSRKAIQMALASHLRNQPRQRPTPGAIREKARSMEAEGSGPDRGDRSKLSADEAYTLEHVCIPKMRDWVHDNPPSDNLHQHGKKFLEYWGAE